MPSELRVVNQKFLAKLNNGDDFTINDTTDFARHLKGGVLEEIKAVFNVQIEWYVGLTSYNTLYNSSASTLRIEKSGLNFSNNGFSVGDTVKLSQAVAQFEGDVSSLKVGEIILENVVLTNGSYNDGYLTQIAGTDPLTGISAQTALKYKFGLIENLEPFNTLSKLTNSDQIFLFDNIDHFTPGTFSQGVSFGNNKAWVTGSAQVAFIQRTPDKDYNNNQNTTQEFQIEHTFRINPLYRDGEEDSLNGTDISPEDIYNGDKSLKYVLEAEFRTVLNNPNTSKNSKYDSQQGSVGYLDESYNGYDSDFSVSDVTYFNVTDSAASSELTVGAVNTVTFKINSNSSLFSSPNPVIIGHTAIVDSTDYSNGSEDYDTIWSNDSVRSDGTASTFDGDIIKDLQVLSTIPSQLEISVNVDLTNASVAGRLEEGQTYLLYYTVADPSNTVDEGSKVTGTIDVNAYDKNGDIFGLYQVDKFEQYPHPEAFIQGTSQGFTNALTFNESGMMSDARFWVDNDAVLEDLKFDIVVFNKLETTWSVLRSFEFDLSEQVLVNGIQQIEIDSTRGYVLKEDDIFNYVKITTDNNDGTKQYYNLQVGYKIPWQSWLEFPDAPTIFYDTEKSFNGFNQKASNYSMVGTGENTFTDGDNGTFEDDDEPSWGLTLLNSTPNEVGDSLSGLNTWGRLSNVALSYGLDASTMNETSKIYSIFKNDNGINVVEGTSYEISCYTALHDVDIDANLLDNSSLFWLPTGYTVEELDNVKAFDVTLENSFNTLVNPRPLLSDWKLVKTVFTAKATGTLTFEFDIVIKNDINESTFLFPLMDDVKTSEVEYGIKVLLDANLGQSGITTNYVTSSEDIAVYDYNTDDQTPDAFSCVINTYNDLGIPLENNIIEERFTELRAIFTPLVPPSFSESVDFTEVDTIWNRFAHGNELLSPATVSPRIGDWTNEQADDDDTFADIGGSPHTKGEVGLYSSTSTSINTNDNCNAFYGCYSLDSFEFYSISGTMFSDASDNDALGYNVAFFVDEQGVEHTLTLLATTGGVLLDLNPGFMLGDNQTSTIAFTNNVASWALVYDFGKRDAKQLLNFNTTESGFNWNSAQVGDLFFDVQRSANDIVIDVDWTINGTQFVNTFNYNLNDDPDGDTLKFMGFQQIGFSFMSQDQGGFKDVILTKPEADFYGILRMETEESPSDFSINELSTLNEAPENNLLTNLSGTEKKALLSYDGENFILQGEIDTSQLREGENYKFSAELRSINLEA